LENRKVDLPTQSKKYPESGRERDGFASCRRQSNQLTSIREWLMAQPYLTRGGIMNIQEDDYILGVWYCEKFRGKHKGYAIVIARKPKQRDWQLIIKSSTLDMMDREPVILTFDDFPSLETMKARGELVFEPAKIFFPDFSEYIEVKGHVELLLLAIAEAKCYDKIRIR
jgi:hypothetical protein